MMSSARRVTSLLCACAVLGGCGGRVYSPAAASMGKSVEAMVPVIDSDLADYPNELRLENADAGFLTEYKSEPSELLCMPVRSSVEMAASSNKLQNASESLIRVSGESPTSFSELAAATLSKYAVAAGDVDPAKLGDDAHQACIADFKFNDAYDAFISTGGAESLQLTAAGLTELWGLVKPIAVGVLGIVDQQRREQAILAYLRTDGPQLKKDVDALATFSKTKAAYERAVAAKAFAAAMSEFPAQGATDEQRQAVLAAAATYDTLRAIDPTTSYEAVSESIERLINVSKGQYTEADLGAAISGFGQSFTALKQVGDNIAALRKGGDKNDDLRTAIAKIRGKQPEAAAAAEDEEAE
jgi:hypothetical protein